MLPWKKCVLIGLTVLSLAAPRLDACQERVLSLRFSPSAGRANNWCWAATGEMLRGLLGEDASKACQCRQAEEVLGVEGCCVAPSSCLPADELPASATGPVGWRSSRSRTSTPTATPRPATRSRTARTTRPVTASRSAGESSPPRSAPVGP